MQDMEFRVLGSFEVVAGDSVTAVTAPKQRELLALLLIHANEPLSSDRIMDELWGDDPPGQSTLRFHVSKLRGFIGVDPSPLATTGNGYRLNLDGIRLDAQTFEEEVVAAGEAMESDNQAAAEHIGRARELWRGAPYPGVEYQRFAEIEIRRLNELHLTFLARDMEVKLAAGRHDEAVSGLEELVNRHPLHERFWELLMLALYRSGRQAEALRAFGRAKEVLGEELGIDPSASLANLEEQILLQAPSISYVSASPTNLPTPASSFVGREFELTELRDLVIADRVVTLGGPGGIGKTRLAVELGHRVRDQFSDGAWFCDLSGVAEGGVAEAVVAALPTEEQPEADPLEAAAEWTADRAALLIVDNCEHVVDAAGDVIHELIARSPRLHVIATSRQRLGVDGEHVWDMDGLVVPAPDAATETLLASDAVQLLVDRARRADRTFHFSRDEAPGVAGLTIALDGVPLALELVAARLRTTSVGDMLTQINTGLEALGDARRRGPERHRTMQATLDWSYRLLDEPTASALRKLGVFRSGFDEAAAAHVLGIGDDVSAILERLVDVSFIKRDRGAPRRRFRMLEVIREYAAALLDDAEAGAAASAHGEYFEAFSAEQSALMDSGDRAAAIGALRRDHDNLRLAIANSRADGLAREVNLVANLGAFWFDAGFHAEAREAFAAAIETGTQQPSRELVSAIEQQVQLYSWSGSLDRAYELAELQREAANALDDDWAHSRVTASEGILGFITGDYRTAIEAYERMLEYPSTHETATVAYITASLAYLYTWTGDPERAEEWYRRCMDHADRLDLDDRDGIAGDFKGWAAFQRGDLDEAQQQWQAGEDAYAKLGLRPMQADMMQLRGWALLTAGEVDAARPPLQESTEEMDKLGLAAFTARGRMLMAAAERSTDPVRSKAQLADAYAAAVAIRSRVTAAWCLWYGADVAAAEGRRGDCLALRGGAEALFVEIPLDLPAGFRARDAELLELAGLESWPSAKLLGVEAARAHIVG